MANQPPSRRRFQFRLRTLMIAVTLLAVPLGYVGCQAKIVRERRSFIESHPNYRYSRFFFRQTPSWVRAFLGDESFNVVALPMDATKQERDSAFAIFPEAEILAINPIVWIGHRNRTAMPKDFVPFPNETR